MQRKIILSIFCFVLGVGFAFYKRLSGSVILEKLSPAGYGVIKVVELQRAPFSLEGLLGLGDPIHRCEYILHLGWPATSAISFLGESYFPSRIEIEWTDADFAKVSLDEQATFYLVKGFGKET